MSEDDPLIQTESEYGTVKPLGQQSRRLSYLSELSMTDLFPKTNMFLTTINVVKSFIGLGILASPSGY